MADEQLIQTLISPSSNYDEEYSLEISRLVSPTEKEMSGQKAASSYFCDPNHQFSLRTIGMRTSRNNDSREAVMNHFDPNGLSQKFTISEENNSIGSKDLFNFSLSDTRKEMSSIALEEPEIREEICTPQEEEEENEDSDPLTPQELQEYMILQQRRAELESRIRQIEEKKLKSDKSSEGRIPRKINEISEKYGQPEGSPTIENDQSQKQGGNDSVQTVVGVHTVTMPSTHIKDKTSTESDTTQSCMGPTFISRNITASTLDPRHPKNHSGDYKIIKSRRGIPVEDTTYEGVYFKHLEMNDDDKKKPLTGKKEYQDIFNNNNCINLDVRRELSFDESHDNELPPIEENICENMESSTDRICEFDENQEPNRNLNAAIRSFIDDRTAKRSSVKDSSVSMGSHHRSNSSIKENIRYSQVDEDKENSTLSKILDHVELKYITNNSERRKERQQYEEDVDECKMLIDFQNTSHLKETPNISSSSNMKSYGKYDSESQKPTGKKFIRHTRRSSYQDPEEVIPVKEVNIFDIHANFDDRITNLRSFYEPENQDPDKVVLEWQNIDNMGTSPVELNPSPEGDNNQKTLSYISDQNSEMKDPSIMELFSEDNQPIIEEEEKRPFSQLEITKKRANNPSMIQLSKFKTFNNGSLLEGSLNPTESKDSEALNSKFTSHTIQCREKKAPKQKKTTILSKRRSLSRNEKAVDTKKRKHAYNYIKKNIQSIHSQTYSSNSETVDKRFQYEKSSTYMKDTESLKIRKGISKKPKISKPTKTKTVKMSISEDGQGKILKTDGSLRGSKESISFRGSIQSKNTPYNTEDSLKFSGFSSTKPNTQTTSDQTRALRSNPGSSEQDKSKKIAHAKRLLNNSKSQNLFEKNPIRTNSKNNRLKKMKNRLDRQRNLINEITSIKQQMSTRIPQKIQKRSTSRTNRRNTVLPKETGTQNPNKILASRSRSRTGNSNSKIPKTSTKKVGINKIAHHTSKLSRNNSSNNTKSLKTRSFMNSTATYYNKGNQYSGKSMSGNKPRVYPAKEQCNKDSIYTTKGKDSYTKIMKKRQSISLNKNKLGLKKQNRSKSRRSSNSRNVACKVIHRCGSVGHVSPMNSLRENTSTQNSRKNIRKGNAGNTTGSDRSTNKFMRSRKSHSTLAENNQGLNDVKESVHNHLAGKGIISSFAGIETITFNLSSKVKMLKETNFF